MTETRNSIEHVVEEGLCHRCGACLPMCPIPQCITLGDDLYPRVNAETCIECGVCERVCSGERLDLAALKATRPGPPPPHRCFGGFHQPWVGFEADPAARARGASGGFVTALLASLLERGEIEGAVVAAADPAAPWTARPIIARTPEAVRQAAGSIYTAVPMVGIMHQLFGRDRDRYAFVGVACHIHSLLMMLRARPHLQSKIRFTIGLFCKSAFDPEAITDLLRCAKAPLEEVEAVEYRSGSWPGIMQARMKGGRTLPLHQPEIDFKDGAYNYLMSMYTQPRCWQCFDFGNELSDLAVGDPWGRDTNGEYEHAGGQTLVIPRTAAGLELIELARGDRRLRLAPLTEEYVRRSPASYAATRAQAVSRALQLRKSRGRAIPRYDRTLPAASWRVRLRETLYARFVGLRRFPRLRRRVLGAFVSRPGLVLVYLRQIVKYGPRGFRRSSSPAEERPGVPIER